MTVVINTSFITKSSIMHSEKIWCNNIWCFERSITFHCFGKDFIILAQTNNIMKLFPLLSLLLFAGIVKNATVVLFLLSRHLDRLLPWLPFLILEEATTLPLSRWPSAPQQTWDQFWCLSRQVLVDSPLTKPVWAPTSIWIPPPFPTSISKTQT